jgi:hypothetical protein
MKINEIVDQKSTKVEETTSSGSIGTAMPSGKGSPNVGTLFGGNYKPKTPFTAKKKAGKK